MLACEGRTREKPRRMWEQGVLCAGLCVGTCEQAVHVGARQMGTMARGSAPRTRAAWLCIMLVCMCVCGVISFSHFCNHPPSACGHHHGQAAQSVFDRVPQLLLITNDRRRGWLSAAVEVPEEERAAGQTAPAVDALLGLHRSRRQDRDERRRGNRHGRRRGKRHACRYWKRHGSRHGERRGGRDGGRRGSRQCGRHGDRHGRRLRAREVTIARVHCTRERICSSARAPDTSRARRLRCHGAVEVGHVVSTTVAAAAWAAVCGITSTDNVVCKVRMRERSGALVYVNRAPSHSIPTARCAVRNECAACEPANGA